MRNVQLSRNAVNVVTNSKTLIQFKLQTSADAVRYDSSLQKFHPQLSQLLSSYLII